MAIQNNHLMSVLREMAATYIRVAGAKTDYEDQAIALSLVERALADALGTNPELLSFTGPDQLDRLPPQLQAHIGRLFALRATLLFELKDLSLASHSARQAALALRQSLGFLFGEDGLEERRYAANFLHQLLTHPMASSSFSTEEAAELYEQLFQFYAQARLLDRAEDMLFHAIDLRADPAKILQEGRAFYRSLKGVDEQTLRRDGLSPQEVDQALEEIQILIDENTP